MRELELKDLAPYLPYGLTGIWIQPGRKTGKVFKMASITTAGSIFMIRSTKTTVRADARPLDEFKPLLIPLIELTDEHAFYIANVAYAKYDISAMIKKGLCNKLEYWRAERLFELHYDFFNLIESGLALNKLEAAV
ncbi:MAG: hypothetical protein JWQ66_2930 [Mucilaginibacter sp.]|nr:hypothetical protein [Mucilaginibacter sp.]